MPLAPLPPSLLVAGVIPRAVICYCDVTNGDRNLIAKLDGMNR